MKIYVLTSVDLGILCDGNVSDLAEDILHSGFPCSSLEAAKHQARSDLAQRYLELNDEGPDRVHVELEWEARSANGLPFYQAHDGAMDIVYCIREFEVI